MENVRMKSRKVLIYYPPNKRAIGLNAVLDLLSGHNLELFVLTQQPYGQLHEDIESKLAPGHCQGLNIAAERGSAFYHQHARALIRFCRKNKIDFVFSHLQVGNLVSILASPFLPGVKTLYFRHHFHYYKKFKVDYLKTGRKDLLGEKLIGRFAKKIVVPSETVKAGMIQYENIRPEKITIIPYIYNFDEYPPIDQNHVAHIREKHPSRLLLLMCSRFVEAKRHELVLEILNRLVNQQALDIEMILLDEGPLKNRIKEKAIELKLDKRLHFVGYTTGVLNFMAACDLMVHPSLAEASNSSVKEMAFAGRTSIVCSGVGDFDDYITNRMSGFLLDPVNSEAELEQTLLYAYDHVEEVRQMGAVLKKEVIDRFSPSEKVLAQYKALLD